jgi:nicotinamide-nucleotide amidase
MAEGVRAKCRTTYGVSISGIAGPDGGTEEKPVGTFFVGVAGPEGVIDFKCLYVNDRRSIRAYAAHVALDIVRRVVARFEIPERYPIGA